MVSQCTASRPTITAWTLLTWGSRPHTGEQEQAHVPLCTVSTDRLQTVPFMPWGYITDISLHVLKPFDHRKAETPVLEILKTIYFEWPSETFNLTINPGSLYL